MGLLAVTAINMKRRPSFDVVIEESLLDFKPRDEQDPRHRFVAETLDLTNEVVTLTSTLVHFVRTSTKNEESIDPSWFQDARDSIGS